MHQYESVTSAISHRLGGYVDPQGTGMRSHIPVERKWALGLQVVPSNKFFLFTSVYSVVGFVYLKIKKMLLYDSHGHILVKL